MGLSKCGECGRDVSARAAACPGCGAPIAGAAVTQVSVTRPGAKWEAAGFVMIAVGLVWMLAGGHWGGALLTVGFVVFLVGRFK